MSQAGIPHNLLVIARSARMLVQLARVAGFETVAIDCFADEDTRQMAIETVRVQALELQDVQPVIGSMCSKYGLTHVVFGSGFEHHLETLEYLGNNLVVLGNSAELFRQFQDKCAFFAGLKQLGIRYPDTRFSPPTEGGTWLEKPMRGEGGADIALYNPDRAVEMGQCYWQRYLPAESMSALFLASHGRITLLGFNRQWCATIDEKQPMLFAGVISRIDLSEEHRQLLSDWLTKLLQIYPLQGLGSLDFMLLDNQCYALEVNPRIPASAQLYGDSIFAMHIQACQGGVSDSALAVQPRGYQVLYANHSLTITDKIQWPDWAVDRPSGGSFIGKGEPICSIIAAGKTAEQVRLCLRQRQNFIEKLFKIGL